MKTINSKFANLHRFIRIAYVKQGKMIFIREGSFNTIKERTGKEGDKEFCYLIINNMYLFVISNHNMKESSLQEIKQKEEKKMKT